METEWEIEGGKGCGRDTGEEHILAERWRKEEEDGWRPSERERDRRVGEIEEDDLAESWWKAEEEEEALFYHSSDGRPSSSNNSNLGERGSQAHREESGLQPWLWDKAVLCSLFSLPPSSPLYPTLLSFPLFLSPLSPTPLCLSHSLSFPLFLSLSFPTFPHCPFFPPPLTLFPIEPWTVLLSRRERERERGRERERCGEGGLGGALFMAFYGLEELKPGVCLTVRIYPEASCFTFVWFAFSVWVSIAAKSLWSNVFTVMSQGWGQQRVHVLWRDVYRGHKTQYFWLLADCSEKVVAVQLFNIKQHTVLASWAGSYWDVWNQLESV